MLKRILAMLLTLIMLFSSIPPSVTNILQKQAELLRQIDVNKFLRKAKGSVFV